MQRLHSAAAGKSIVGPSLFGIVGRQARTIPGFRYSPANKDSGRTWDAAALDHYLTGPQAIVPKTIMTCAGLNDETKRANLIAYPATRH